MADQERDIHIPFNSGFDDFTDDRWKPDGRISTITNAEWNQEGRLEKRRGFEAFTVTGVKTGTLSAYGNTFVSAAQEHLAVYLPSEDTLRTTKFGMFVDTRTYPVAGFTGSSPPNMGIGYGGGYYLVAWSEPDTRDLCISLVDAETRQPKIAYYKVDSSRNYGRLRAYIYGTTLIVVANCGAGMDPVIMRATIAAPTTWAATNITGYFDDGDDQFDSYLDTSTGTIIMAGQDIASDTSYALYAALATSGGIIGGTVTATADAVGFNRFCVNKIGNDYYASFEGDNINIVRFDNTLSPVIPMVAATTSATGTFSTIGPSGNATYPVMLQFYSVNISSSLPDTLATQVYTTALVMGFQNNCNKMWPAVAPFVCPVSGDSLFGLKRFDLPASTAVDADAITTNVLAFIDNSFVGNSSMINYPPAVKGRYGPYAVEADGPALSTSTRALEVSAGRYATVELFKTQTMPPAFNLSIVEWAFDAVGAGKGVQLGDSLHLRGGAAFFDGNSLCENGFIGVPDLYDVTYDNSGSLTASSSYLWALGWEWQDANGDTHRGAPYTAREVLGVLQTRATLLFGGTGPTSRSNQGGYSIDPVISLYRTQSGQETLSRVYPQTTVSTNAIQAFAATMVDGVADAAIASNPVIYTDGAQVPPLPTVTPASFIDIDVYKNRVVGLADDGLTLWFSTEKRPGEAVRFADELNVVIVDGGRASAIAAEQNRVLVFKDNDIFALYGEGADERGVGANFAFPAQIAQSIGCTRPESVLATPVGTFFQGGPGVMRVVGANVDFIGNAVRDTFPGNVSAVAHSAEQQKVFFGCHNDALTEFMILVFDYRFSRWTKWTYTHPTSLTGENLKIIGMVVYDNRLHCALGDRTYIIRQKQLTSSSSHLDYTNTWVTMEVEFAPIKTSGPQGFQHVKKVMVIGEQGSRHNLSVSFANDYDSTYYQTVNWSAAVIDTWTTLPLEQFSSKPGRPRCEAIKIKINDATPSTGAQGTGQGLKLVGLSLTVANKTRLMRLGSTYKR